MRVINPAARQKDQAAIDALKAFMAGRVDASLKDIRDAVPDLRPLTDAQLATAARDAGYEVLI